MAGSYAGRELAEYEIAEDCLESYFSESKGKPGLYEFAPSST